MTHVLLMGYSVIPEHQVLLAGAALERPLLICSAVGFKKMKSKTKPKNSPLSKQKETSLKMSCGCLRRRKYLGNYEFAKSD